jgi:hypothetical protein
MISILGFSFLSGRRINISPFRLSDTMESPLDKDKSSPDESIDKSMIAVIGCLCLTVHAVVFSLHFSMYYIFNYNTLQEIMFWQFGK